MSANRLETMMKKNRLINKIASKMQEDSHLLSEDLYGFDIDRGTGKIDMLLQIMEQDMMDWDFDDPEFIDAIIHVYGEEKSVDELLAELEQSGQDDGLKSIIFRMSGKQYDVKETPDKKQEVADKFVIGSKYDISYRNYAGVDQVYKNKRLFKIKEGANGHLLVFSNIEKLKTFHDRWTGQTMLAKQYALNKIDGYKKQLADLQAKHLAPKNRSAGIKFVKNKIDKWLYKIKFDIYEKVTLNSNRITKSVIVN